MNWTNVDSTDGNLALIEEFEKGFQGTDSRGLDAHAFLGLIDVLFEDINEISSNAINSILNLIFSLAPEQFGTGNGAFEARSRYLNTHSALNLLVMLILTFHTHFLHWEWCQQCSDIGANGTVETRNHDSIAYMDNAIDEHNIDCGSVTLDDLYFENSALKCGLLGQIFALMRLTHPAQIEDKIGETLACDGGSWHKTEGVLGRCVVPVETDIEALLIECQNGLLKLSFEMVHGVLFLFAKCITRIFICVSNPTVEAINLVESDTERHFLRFEELQRLEGLVLETVHNIDDKHGHITK